MAMSDSVQSQTVIDKPLLGYVVVEIDYHEDRDRPIHSFVSSPFATREKAEREAEKREEAYQNALEEKDMTPYDEKDFSVTEIKIHGLRQLTPMDDDRYETLQDAVNAVGASLLAEEGIGPLAGGSD